LLDGLLLLLPMLWHAAEVYCPLPTRVLAFSDLLFQLFSG